MICPKCNHPIGVYATEDIVREHAEDYGYVKLPSVEEFEDILNEHFGGVQVQGQLPIRLVAQHIHSALQGGKHA